MALAQAKHPFTEQDYLSWEALQPDRYEYFRGEVFAMAGGTQNHNTVALNTAFALRQHLAGTPCKVFVADVRVKLADAYFYPDVMVSCQAQDVQDGAALSVQSPVLIVKVLSDSTASTDRGVKFAAYRGLVSLREYVLIDVDAHAVDVFRRNEMGRFELFAFTSQDEVPACQWASVDLTLTLATLFEGVVPAAPRLIAA